jgi:glutamate-5-semialdehyde dehydrogenase
MSIKKMAMAAKEASHAMANASTKQKDNVIRAMIANIKDDAQAILAANKQDIIAAEAERLNAALIDRLLLEGRLDGMIQDIEQVLKLPDPIGECFDESKHHGKLEIAKCRTPIGVLGVIYESRPNVTIDVSALVIKSGNCAILRGGSETILTNQALVKAIQKALISENLPIQAIQLVVSPDRKHVNQLLKMHEYIDLIIPRGGASLHEFCRKKSTIPVITGGVGVCHLFVDDSADIKKSLPLILNAKTQRPTVCNALDTLLVHEKIAAELIPQVVGLLQKNCVVFKMDEQSLKCVSHKDLLSSCQLANAEDWYTEWLSLVLGIRIVRGLDEAIHHIRKHSTGHSDGILTQNKANAERFIREIDSAAVYVNASTRFTDGAQLGLGAEVAISTQKLHARGPMGLKELTSYKWVIKGDYAIRS